MSHSSTDLKHQIAQDLRQAQRRHPDLYVMAVLLACLVLFVLVLGVLSAGGCQPQPPVVTIGPDGEAIPAPIEGSDSPRTTTTDFSLKRVGVVGDGEVTAEVEVEVMRQAITLTLSGTARAAGEVSGDTSTQQCFVVGLSLGPLKLGVRDWPEGCSRRPPQSSPSPSPSPSLTPPAPLDATP